MGNNQYWYNICAIAERQRAKGIDTYGYGIESNPADVITRIEYLQEELVDGLMYCEWVKDYLMKRASEIVKVEIPFYDKEETYPDCTVQVLTNTATGDVSVGWWENERS